MSDETSSRFRFWRGVVGVLLWYGVTLLPFDFLPLRFEGHETHRAGLMLLLAICGAGALLVTGLQRRHDGRQWTGWTVSAGWTVGQKVFITALLVLAVVLMLSAVFALSPVLALTGDLVRRMGLLTQLALIILVLMMRVVDWRWLASGFWFAGVIAAVYTLLQVVGWLPNPIAGRAFGPLGAPTFTAGWLVNALIWSAVWVASERAGENASCRWLHWIRLGGLLLMGAGLLATGGRGALLGLLAAGIVGIVAYGWVMRRRVLIWLLAGGGVLAVCIGIGAAVISQLDWQTSPVASWPLISRLNPTLPDTPRAVREQVWGNALDIMTAPPLFTASDGEPDRWHALRFWFGYGQDHFERVHRPWVDDALRAMEQGRPIDRAHNLFADLMVMHGAAGLMAWLAVWGGAALIAVHRLRMARQSGGRMWLPLLVLMIVTAHIVDLLFSFETVAAGWGAWLALGLVLHRDGGDGETVPVTTVPVTTASPALMIVTCGAATLLFIRAVMQLPVTEAAGVTAPAVVVLCGTVAAAGAVWVGVFRRRFVIGLVLAVGVGAAVGGLLSGVQGADAAALLGLGVSAVLVCALGAGAGVRWQMAGWVVIPVAVMLLVVAGYVFNETRAQIRFQQGLASDRVQERAETHRAAALDFPLDYRLQRYAASALYYAAVNRIDRADVGLLQAARQFGQAAVGLHPYDADAQAVLDEIDSVLVSPDG